MKKKKKKKKKMLPMIKRNENAPLDLLQKGRIISSAWIYSKRKEFVPLDLL